MKPPRLLIVDDHAIVREGLRTLLSEEPDLEIAGEAANGEEALEACARLGPDVVLLDLAMPGLDGLGTLRRWRQTGGGPPAVLVLTSFAEEGSVRQAIELGALGYLLKDVSRAELVAAVRGAKHGRPALHAEAQRHLMRQIAAPLAPSPLTDLTPRETSVLAEIAQGRSNRQIAKTLHLSEGTVKGYVSTVLSKLGVEDRTQAALLAVREGLGEKVA